MLVAELGGGKLDVLSPRAAEDVGEGDDDGDRHSTSSDSSDDDGMGKMKKYVIQVGLCVCMRSRKHVTWRAPGRRHAERGPHAHDN